MVHTSHAALYAIGAQVLGNVANSVCGHPVDLTMIDIPAMSASIIALFLDIYKRWNVRPVS